MAGPFPGMDPFLESPAYFPSLHSRMIYVTAEMLEAKLPDPYFADMNERLWVEASDRQIEPDVDVLRTNRPKEQTSANVATAARSQPIIITVSNDEIRETFVEIFTRQGDRERLVTTIEILSLANKKAGRRGRKLYLAKQREILENGNINLVEIDLLRKGTHATAIPEHRLKRDASPFDYHVSIYHCDEPTKFRVYAIQLPERLPEIAIPLLPGDGTVSLDLQAVLDRSYDAAPYKRRVTYDIDKIVPPLAETYREWATTILANRTKTSSQSTDKA